MLSEDIVHINHQYRTNMEMYSLIPAWGLEFEDTVDKVQQVLKELIVEEYLDGLEYVLEWVVSGVGINISECMVEPGNPIPFVHWSEDEVKVRCKAVTWNGWEAFKTFVGLMRVEEALEAAHELARVEMALEMRPRARIEEAM